MRKWRTVDELNGILLRLSEWEAAGRITETVAVQAIDTLARELIAAQGMEMVLRERTATYLTPDLNSGSAFITGSLSLRLLPTAMCATDAWEGLLN